MSVFGVRVVGINWVIVWLVCSWTCLRSYFVDVSIPLISLLNLLFFNFRPIITWCFLRNWVYWLFGTVIFLFFLSKSKLGGHGIFLCLFGDNFLDALKITKLPWTFWLGLWLYICCSSSWNFWFRHDFLLKKLGLQFGIFTHIQVNFAPHRIINITCSGNRHVDWSFLVELS